MHTADSFWQWFINNQQRFQQLEQLDSETAHGLLNEVVEELKKYNDWFKALMGRYDDNTNELVITADGDIALFVKVEELISKAPPVSGWRFTAHKPPLGFDEISIEMFDKTFDDETVHFYPLIDEAYPDMVSIVFTHSAYDEKEEEDFRTAGSIYVQNALGELNTATQLDHYEIGAEPEDKSQLIPVTKLNDYLNWREKEFIEKYDHATIEFPEPVYNTIEGEDPEANVMLAIAVASYEEWPYKPVYSWWVGVEMEYTEAENGLPDENTLTLLHDIEDKISELLSSHPEIVYVATKTFRGQRTIYYYARDYRQPSLLLHPFMDSYEGEIGVGFFIEKDKYWQRMEEFYGLADGIRSEDDEEE